MYGSYVTEFNDVADIARMFMGDYFKGINSFDYIEMHKQVTKEYAEEILNETLKNVYEKLENKYKDIYLKTLIYIIDEKGFENCIVTNYYL